MVGFLCSTAAGFVLLLMPTLAAGQDLTPALADRFSRGVADLKAGNLDAAETTFREVLREGGERAFVHHNLGLVLRERGRDADALIQFQTASKLDPSYGPAHLLSGTSLIALRRYREARSELEHAARLMPREVAVYSQLADACRHLDDRLCVAKAYGSLAGLAPGDAEYAYRLGSAYLKVSEWAHERLTNISPEPARLHQALGREYLNQGRTDLATDAFQRAAAADPRLPDVHLALARNHFDAGRTADASRELDRELAIVPFSKDALDLKARIQPKTPDRTEVADGTGPVAPSSFSSGIPEIDTAVRERKWETAERLLADQIERRHDSRDLLVLIARIFVLDDKPLNAAVALKKADAIAPLDREQRFTLVLAYIRLGRGDWAEPELERLSRDDPQNAEYRYWMGRLDYDAGKYASAIGHLNDALARDPQLARAHDNLGLCYEALDDPDTAITHYREAIRLNRAARSRSPWPPTNLGILLRQRGETDEAAALFREALGYDDGFAKGHYELGVLLDQRRQTADAVVELERAASLDRTFAEPHYLLARLYRLQGQNARADEALATFLRLRSAREKNAK
jgi:tetratricopeptide (TPR) repeat protein